MSSLPPWKNVYKSGRWPDPNNNLLRACLPRHNALQSQGGLSNMAAPALNPFFFFHPTIISTRQCSQTRDLVAFSADLIHIYSSVAWDWEFCPVAYSSQSLPVFSVMPEQQSVSFRKETSPLLKNVSPILTWPHRHESENESVFCS